MTFPAIDAQILTGNAITDNAARAVQDELANCEIKIRQATALGQYQLGYNATIIGNPKANPTDSSNLTDNQETFYDLLVNAGYLVSLQVGTGYWQIDWSLSGPETLVSVYTFRTTVAPGAIHTATVNALQDYFNAQIPVHHARATVNGFIDEAEFGGITSTFYEYTIVVDQEFDTTDFSAGAKNAVLNAGLGYNTNTCKVYKLL